MKHLALLIASTAICTATTALPVLAQESRTIQSEPAASTRPNAPDQQPAFEGQTRAAQPAAMTQLQVSTIAEDLPPLWALEILPDGMMVVTAKAGAMHLVSPEGKAGPALSGVPEVAASGQGGLLDVALASDFAETNRIFFSFSEPRDDGNGTSVASAVLRPDGKGGGALENVEIIFRQTPSWNNNKHYGSRLVPTEDGHLYVTVGERSDREPRVQAQELGSGLGKVFRISTEGQAAEGNPFAAQSDALPEIWSYGHRNMQSAALDGQGRLWTVEHGPKGGDELNRPEAGKNYGWPVITYGVEYSGGAVGEGQTDADGMEQPVYYWDPVIGPSGMAFYQGDAFPNWRNTFLIGGLVTTDIVVVHLDGDKVASEERIPLDARIRDVKVGADGAIYAVTESRGGSTILKLTAAGG